MNKELSDFIDKILLPEKTVDIIRLMDLEYEKVDIYHHYNISRFVYIYSRSKQEEVKELSEEQQIKILNWSFFKINNQLYTILTSKLNELVS